MSALTIITASGTRYEIDEAFGTPVVRRLAPCTGEDSLADSWPDGTCKFVDKVAIIDHPYNRVLGSLALVIVIGWNEVVTTSPIVSLTEGILG